MIGLKRKFVRWHQKMGIVRIVAKQTVLVPIQKMPLIDEPFQHVAVDLVGPIQPATNKGNRFILTLVEYATRFPLAVP